MSITTAATALQQAPEKTDVRNDVRVARQQLNVQILQSSVKVSISAGDQSQSLVFRSAIDRINDLLTPTFGPNALQNTVASGIDTSPEATADRILSISTGFFDRYAAQHPGKDPEKLATDFVNTIRRGFEKGYGEARNILEGLGVFNGDVKSGVTKTYDLVQKGYDDFLAGKLDAIKTAKAGN